jgi:hypothetical protein
VLTSAFWNTNVRENTNAIRAAQINVKQAVKRDADSTTSPGGTFVNIVGDGATGVFEVKITPSATTSKVLVVAAINVGMTDANFQVFFRLVRDSTNIAQSTGAAAQNQTLNAYIASASALHGYSVVWLDSPATTSETTYKLQWARNTSGTAHINRQGNANDYRSVSTITAIEVPV